MTSSLEKIKVQKKQILNCETSIWGFSVGYMKGNVWLPIILRRHWEMGNMQARVVENVYKYLPAPVQPAPPGETTWVVSESYKYQRLGLQYTYYCLIKLFK